MLTQKITLLSLVSLMATSLLSKEAVLVNLKRHIPTLVVDLRYTTNDNFTHQPLYPHNADAYLAQQAAHALRAVQQELMRHGYGLKIWDAYRPLSVQRKLWAIVPDPRYVADPATGSRHNRGFAVDCTLIDLATGNELEMPTEFDDFTEKAHRDYTGAPATAIANRTLLENVMRTHGFEGLPTEWWHFDYRGWHEFDVLDIDFNQLTR